MVQINIYCSDEIECMPIIVSRMDSFYEESFDCLEFARSVPYCVDNGGPRQQWNAINSYMDASNVYGSTDEMADELRSKTDGKLKIDGNNLLPDKGPNLLAGDVRNAEMPGLASMHTLFVREHNRICDLIKTVRPEWDDEKVFQNARRILIGQYQSIVYAGYLPVVLGSENMDGLALSAAGSEYDDTLDPSMTNEFATAADRFGHSMIQGLIKLFHTDNSGQFDEFVLGQNWFNKAKYRSYMDNILMGLMSQPAQAFDKSVTDQVTNFLFPEKHDTSATSDLAARNIQRGRDHGLPGFCCYYKLYQDENKNCNEGWDMKYEGISQTNWQLLQEIYLHPNDIDLFTGGLAQEPYNGAVVGTVFWFMLSM